MKNFTFKTLVVAALSIVLCTVPVLAANTISIADDGISISEYKNSLGEVDENYVTITVNYSATQDPNAEPMSRITFALAALSVEEELAGNDAKVIYLDETLAPTGSNYTFVAEKARVQSALGLSDISEIEGQSLLFKMGGVGVETAATKTVVYTTPQKAQFGDVNMDGTIDYSDAIIILQYAANKVTLTQEQLVYADTLGDGAVDYRDAIVVLQYSARIITYDDILTARAANQQN